jgi:hypothetical protein
VAQNDSFRDDSKRETSEWGFDLASLPYIGGSENHYWPIEAEAGRSKHPQKLNSIPVASPTHVNGSLRSIMEHYASSRLHTCILSNLHTCKFAYLHTLQVQGSILMTGEGSTV